MNANPNPKRPLAKLPAGDYTVFGWEPNRPGYVKREALKLFERKKANAARLAIFNSVSFNGGTLTPEQSAEASKLAGSIIRANRKAQREGWYWYPADTYTPA